MLVFFLQWISLHWEIPIMLLSQFPLIFRHTEIRMPHADWDGVYDRLRDFLWVDIFELSASAAASKFCGSRLELMYVSLISIRSNHIHVHGFQQFVLLA